MKYILWPLLATLLAISLMTYGTFRMIATSLWHFRIPSIREAYTFDGEYAFKDWSWKIFLRSIFDYDFAQKDDDEQ